jgi:hypothetical protein
MADSKESALLFLQAFTSFSDKSIDGSKKQCSITSASDDLTASGDLLGASTRCPRRIKMTYPTQEVSLLFREEDHFKRLADPTDKNIFHAEAWLPFSEAAKLDKGNANVRSASEKRKPYKDMLATVATSPETFHRKNRGIIYRCERFEFDNKTKTLRVITPVLALPNLEDPDEISVKFGVADGGHTYDVIQQTLAGAAEYAENAEWTEPFVRVHFLAGEKLPIGELEQVVEALNTSSQVQQYSMDEYQNKFEDLKKALTAGGFDISLIGFRENEEKEWEVREIIQRLACFLKDRWKMTQPSSMYKSKGKALDLFTNDSTRNEFERLYDVVVDLITLPEFIQSEFSRGDLLKNHRFGNLRSVKKLKHPSTRPGTNFVTEHEMDLAAALPLAAAFRDLLVLDGERYKWKTDYKKVFRLAAPELYKLLVAKSRSIPSLTALGSDSEFWTQASNIVLRIQNEV